MVIEVQYKRVSRHMTITCLESAVVYRIWEALDEILIDLINVIIQVT